MDLPRIIGHRGAAARAPENTCAGIRRAAALGAGWVEFDVKLTGDGRCILFHDETLERTTDGRGRVAATSYDDIRRLDAGTWFGPEFAGEPVPALDAALCQVSELGLRANIEIKPCPGREVETAATVLDEVAACWPAARPPPLITSFKAQCLATARSARPNWPRGLLCLDVSRDWRARLAALDCHLLGCLHRKLTQRRAARFAAAGVSMLAFTVNDPEKAAMMLKWGVTTFVTDAPDNLLGVI